MLFTRCPDCDTTFRVTDDALQKANGQVRCGRCASVFNAYAERRDAPDEFAPRSDTEPAAGAQPAAALPATAPAPDNALSPQPSAPAKSEPLPSVKIEHAAHAPRERAHETSAPLAPLASPPNSAARAPSGDTFDSMSVADVVAQVEIGVADETAATGEMALQAVAEGASDGISASQVQEVLEGEDEASESSWPLDTPEPRRRVGLWTASAALALVVLAGQSVHHYRAELVANPVVGALVQRSYALLGQTIVPRWDIHQYEILDWIATAGPNTGGQGSLRITARIKNRGPQYQPYPSVHLRLKDRWEEAVGGRVFAPTEYLAAAPRKLMAPGETTRAEIEVVDPGQDAYGFELDVCIEVETHALSCGSDKVFL
jgi:predicted Zn finger-like uncharacterized protein